MYKKTSGDRVPPTALGKVGTLEVMKIDDGPACILLPNGKMTNGKIRSVWISLDKASVILANVPALKAFVANAEKFGATVKASPAVSKENVDLKKQLADLQGQVTEMLNAKKGGNGDSARFQVPEAPVASEEPEEEVEEVVAVSGIDI